MELSHFERLRRQVYTQDLGAFAGHGIGQDTATAPHVQHTFPFDWNLAVDPAQAQGVNLVQGTELAFRVPPAVGQVREFGQLGRVKVIACGHESLSLRHKKTAPRRGS